MNWYEGGFFASLQRFLSFYLLSFPPTPVAFHGRAVMMIKVIGLLCEVHFGRDKSMLVGLAMKM